MDACAYAQDLSAHLGAQRWRAHDTTSQQLVTKPQRGAGSGQRHPSAPCALRRLTGCWRKTGVLLKVFDVQLIELVAREVGTAVRPQRQKEELVAVAKCLSNLRF